MILHQHVHTFGLVEQLVSINLRGGGVPGHPEASVPFVRNAKVSGSEHIHCGAPIQASQHSVFLSVSSFSDLSAWSLLKHEHDDWHISPYYLEEQGFDSTALV